MRNLLKKTYITFFGSFNGLTPVQKEVIPIVLNKRNALIISGTASGKTEAVLAPLIERILKRDSLKGLFLLYIAPTKALTKDIFSRIKGQCQELGITIDIKTGDYPTLRKIPNILITTPESFDSLICRRKSIFASIEAIILDEIHLLDKNYRGEQLSYLLKRLAETVKCNFNIYALSATVSEPKELAKRYMNNFEIIEIENKREIDYSFHKNLDEIYQIAKKENLRKILFFCNKRESVEIISNEAAKYWGNHYTVSHHGSLSKKIRTEAEDFMKNSHFGVCVSTMTLEIGIDIGNIDAVVLAELPWSVSSFLQRIGRANRKQSKIRVLIISESKLEQDFFTLMIESAKKGEIEKEDYDSDLGVVIQQIFSILFANPSGKSLDYFLKIFANKVSKEILILILNHLIDTEWIQKRNERYFASTKLMDLGKIGKIHSNIPNTSEMKVINISNKKTIGKIKYPIDSPFLLAGKIWKIVHIKKNNLYVTSVKENTLTSKFIAHTNKSAFSYLLPVELKIPKKGREK